MDDKIYTNEVITDQPFPGIEVETSGVEASAPTSGGATTQATIPNKSTPTKRIATELLSTVLNTKSRKILGTFELAQNGGIQVGKYENGVSGDVKLTPIGIVARNQSGDITFLLDGDTGDATFKGTIQTGALIAGLVAVGNNNIILDGENQRIIVNDGKNDRVLIGFQANGF